MRTVTFMSGTVEALAPSHWRLWQLISPALPVGAYAYSAGLESAVEQGWVSDEQELTEWIAGVLRNGLGTLDLPLLRRFYGAWERDDQAALVRWSAFLRAARETSEFEFEDRQLGSSLARLLQGLEIDQAKWWQEREDVSYACMFALGAVRWHIPCEDAMRGYGWAWCENQITAAMKLMPLGQTAGQRVLGRVAAQIDAVVQEASHRADSELCLQSPGLALASALHETQYSRLFRS